MAKRILAVQGVQGSGKTFLSRGLCARHPNMTAISLDDFYLPAAQLAGLPYHELWDGRGPPGTHDVDLLRDALASFKANRPFRVPVYNKYANGGRGDREGWRDVSSEDFDLLIVEGWCLGFMPPASLSDDMSRIDAAVDELASLHPLFDGLIVLRVRDYRVVHRWRAEAEAEAAKRRARTGSERTMTPRETRAFLKRYLPCYRRYLAPMYAAPPIRPCLFVHLDEAHMPTGVTLATAGMSV